MRKARIEKLTQEEIHQQQHLAKLRSDNESDQELNDTNTHHLTLPEEQQLKMNIKKIMIRYLNLLTKWKNRRKKTIILPFQTC